MSGKAEKDNSVDIENRSVKCLNKMEDLSLDLENWMGNLPQTLKDLPIINLAIPGSHDSMSYGIGRGSKIAPDAENAVIKMYKIVPCIVRRWAITQRLDILQQLHGGIRFLDFRICMNPKDNRFYFAHGLFCEEISKALKCIGSFLNEHPNEFVIIDCQHFYNFSNGDYGRLERILLNTFEQILYQPKDGSIQELSLSMAHSVQKQMVIIYRYSFVPNQFWPSNCWPTPWPNQISISKLERSLELSLSYRSPDIGYVTQCVLTPPPKFIVPRFLSTLRKSCATKVLKGLSNWIAQQQPGPFQSDSDKPTSNVFIADFIELQDYKFCKLVIALNQKLLDLPPISGE